MHNKSTSGRLRTERASTHGCHTRANREKAIATEKLFAFATWQRPRERIRPIKIICHWRVRACSSQNRKCFQERRKENKIASFRVSYLRMGYWFFGFDWRRMLRIRMDTLTILLSSNASHFILILFLNRLHTHTRRVNIYWNTCARQFQAYVNGNGMSSASQLQYKRPIAVDNVNTFQESKSREWPSECKTSEWIRRRRWTVNDPTKQLILIRVHAWRASEVQQSATHIYSEEHEDAKANILCRQTWFDRVGSPTHSTITI